MRFCHLRGEVHGGSISPETPATTQMTNSIVHLQNLFLALYNPSGDGEVGPTRQPDVLYIGLFFDLILKVVSLVPNCWCRGGWLSRESNRVTENQYLNEVEPEPTPPIFNMPTVIVVLIASFVAVHAFVVWGAGDSGLIAIYEMFSFIPLTYSVDVSQLPVPNARYWSPITHSFLHGDWTHLAVNSVWLAAFGSAVARRFPPLRFILFFSIAAITGALAHYIFHSQSVIPVIGASGAVSACMGAAIRFAFVPGRPMDNVSSSPALTLVQSLSNKQVLMFVGIWFVFNWLFGSGVLPILGENVSIAWEAHMGGFLFGWLMFGLFDPVRPVKH